MAKKTIIRRAAKYLPKTIELAKIINIEEAQEENRNVRYDLDGEVVIEDNVNQVTGEVTPVADYQQSSIATQNSKTTQELTLENIF